MASSSLIPKNGAVVLGSVLCDYNSYSIRATNSCEDVSPYGAQAMAKRVSAGTPGFAISIAAFALAHAANTPPTINVGTGIFAGAGVSTTLTLDTGVAYAGNLVVESYDIGHGRMRAAVPVAISGLSANDWTETWAIV